MSERRRWFPHPLASAALAVMWLMLNATIEPGHLILAAVLGVAIPALTQRLWPERIVFRRVDRFVLLAAIVLRDIVVANIQVARLIVGPARKLRPAFVPVPIALVNPYAASTLAAIVTLTPGTVSAEIDVARNTLLVHALDVANVDDLVAQVHRYESLVREILEC